MGIDIHKHISQADIDRVQLIRNPPPYDAGDDFGEDLELWVDRNQEQHNKRIDMKIVAMKSCPSCGSKLYFDNIQGLIGKEDRCYECGFNREHIEVHVVPKKTLKGSMVDLYKLYRHFCSKR